jgi:phosphoribosylglycinamide formyltransferase-1
MVKTAVLVSGGGTNLQALIDAKRRGELPDTEFVGVISSSPDAYAVTRAKEANIPVYIVDIADYEGNREGFTGEITDTLNSVGAELVITAGFLYITTPRFVNEYDGRIINIHPSLLPSFGGVGCYGIHVHEKALAYGVKITGATAHFVTQEPDTGPIILQDSVKVLDSDTPEALQRRVMERVERKILPEAVRLYCAGKLKIDGRIVKILE